MAFGLMNILLSLVIPYDIVESTQVHNRDRKIFHWLKFVHLLTFLTRLIFASSARYCYNLARSCQNGFKPYALLSALHFFLLWALSMQYRLSVDAKQVRRSLIVLADVCLWFETS